MFGNFISTPHTAQGSHTDAVLTLAWHEAHRTRLASGSADHTVKLWDITTGVATSTLNHHKDKVQCLDFNGTEPSILLSGSYDRSACVVDLRNPSAGRSVTVDADVESAKWCKLAPFMFLVSTENGNRRTCTIFM